MVSESTGESEWEVTRQSLFRFNSVDSSKAFLAQKRRGAFQHPRPEFSDSKNLLRLCDGADRATFLGRPTTKLQCLVQGLPRHF